MNLLLTCLSAPLLLGGLQPVVLRHDRTDASARELAAPLAAAVDIPPGGSGSLIAPTWVLTAAHVARGLSPFSPRVVVGGIEYPVRQSLFHPESKSNGLQPPQVDMALLELARPVEGTEPFPLYDRSDEQGQPVVIAGYGDWGLAGQGFGPGEGVRRAATNTIQAAWPERLHLRFDAPPNATELEGMGAPGDSGGPLLIDVDGVMHLAGVSSGSDGDPGQYGVTDIYVRVSAFLDWIAVTRESAEGADPVRADIRDVSAGWPDPARGAFLEAWFEAFDDADKLRVFGKTRRSADNVRRNPLEGFVRDVSDLASQVGKLTPVQFVPDDPREWTLLVRSENGGWLGMHFWFVERGGEILLDEWILWEEPEPGEAQPDDSGPTTR